MPLHLRSDLKQIMQLAEDGLLDVGGGCWQHVFLDRADSTAPTISVSHTYQQRSLVRQD